jgi:hypothetical protein
MKKSNLGALVMLAGIAIIGFVWFRRNKPTTSDKQLDDLNKQSNALNMGSLDNLDKPFEWSEQEQKNNFINPYTYTSSVIFSEEQQAQIDKTVTESVDCGLGMAWKTGTDCTDYFNRQEKEANPNNINTNNCNPPKLLITNVVRNNIGFPTWEDNGSVWGIYFKLCGGDTTGLPPANFKIIVIDSIGSQEINIDKDYYPTTNIGGMLARRPKTAVINLSLTDGNGRKYIQTFNYKE